MRQDSKMARTHTATLPSQPGTLSGEASSILFHVLDVMFQGVVAAAHTFASTTLLQLLVEDRDLIGHLKSVKKYFLIEQGDFIVQFLDLCDSELSQPVDCVEPAR